MIAASSELNDLAASDAIVQDYETWKSIYKVETMTVLKLTIT